jgi:hypothetical protein
MNMKTVAYLLIQWLSEKGWIAGYTARFTGNNGNLLFNGYRNCAELIVYRKTVPEGLVKLHGRCYQWPAWLAIAEVVTQANPTFQLRNST